MKNSGEWFCLLCQYHERQQRDKTQIVDLGQIYKNLSDSHFFFKNKKEASVTQQDSLAGDFHICRQVGVPGHLSLLSV